MQEPEDRQRKRGCSLDTSNTSAIGARPYPCGQVVGRLVHELFSVPVALTAHSRLKGGFHKGWWGPGLAMRNGRLQRV